MLPLLVVGRDGLLEKILDELPLFGLELEPHELGLLKLLLELLLELPLGRLPPLRPSSSVIKHPSVKAVKSFIFSTFFSFN